MMERGRLSLQHIIHNPLNVKGNNGPAAFAGLQGEAVVGVVVEEILGEAAAQRVFLRMKKSLSQSGSPSE